MKLACAALESVYEVLHRTYGVQAWWPADSTFEVMVGAILTQRTSWHNVELALANLRAAGLLDPGALRGAAPGVLLRAVRPAGYYRQKAARLSALSAWLEDRGGLAGVATLSDAALREELLESELRGRCCRLAALPVFAGVDDPLGDALALHHVKA